VLGYEPLYTFDEGVQKSVTQWHERRTASPRKKGGMLAGFGGGKV